MPDCGLYAQFSQLLANLVFVNRVGDDQVVWLPCAKKCRWHDLLRRAWYEAMLTVRIDVYYITNPAVSTKGIYETDSLPARAPYRDSVVIAADSLTTRAPHGDLLAIAAQRFKPFAPSSHCVL